MNHNCGKARCPICGHERKMRIIRMFEKNPDMLFSYMDIMREFNLSYDNTRVIIRSLIIRGIVVKAFERKDLNDVRLHFNKYNHRNVNTNSWRTI